MSKTRSYVPILIFSRLFLTAMAIHSSLWIAPPDFQQSGLSHIPYVHVPAARTSIVVYIATAINSSLFPLTKHSLFLQFFGTGTEIGAFFYVVYLSLGVSGRPMWSLLGVGCSFNFCIHLVPYLPRCTAFQKLPIELAPISIRAGPIDIPIIKSPVNWWNTSHQPGSIRRTRTSIHVFFFFYR